MQTEGQTDGRTDITKLIVDFRNFSRAPKNSFTFFPLQQVNILNPTGHVMHHQFNNCTLCPHCICVFCIYLRTNSDLCHLQHKLIGFYNRDEVFTTRYGLGL